MSIAVVMIVSRVAITIALLIVAVTLIVVNPAPADDPTAIVIVGTVLGYWLGHAENGIIGVAKNGSG